MDPKMPQIKTEVNKVDDGNKKKSSGLLGLLGGGGSGAGGGLGALGAGAAGSGGLLATKAGMIALVLMGSAVAGGIGLAGYKIFGPSDADKVGSGSLALFQPRQQPATDPNAVAPVNPDGSSASLNYMAQAAAKDKAAEGGDASAAAPTDVTAGNAANDAAKDKALNDAAAKAKGAEGAINSGSGGGAVGSMGKGLAGVKKLGTLSGATGGGGASSASAGSSVKLGEGMPTGTRNGATSGFARGGPGAKSSGGRGAMAGRGRGAMSQMRSIIGDHAGGKVGSSFAAGKTYDGSATQSGGAIGPDGGAIGMDGAGGGGAAQPKSLAANSANQTKDLQPPLPKTKEMVSPWSGAVARAQMLMMLAMALAFLASKVFIPWVRIAIGIAIMAIGAYIGVLAGQVMSGKHKQQTLGALVGAAAVGTLVMGAMTMASSGEKEPSNETKTTETTKETKNPDGSVTKETTTSGGAKAGGILDLPPPLLYGGGIVAVSFLGMMFAPKPKPVELEDGEKKPDISIERRVSPTRYTV